MKLKEGQEIYLKCFICDIDNILEGLKELLEEVK